MIPGREWIAVCGVCAARTPHNRRRFTALRAWAGIAVLVAGWCATVAAPVLALGVLLAGGALLLVDRVRGRVACERCRVKRAAVKRGERPVFIGRRSPIDIF